MAKDIFELSNEELQTMFKDLGEDREAIVKKSAPLRKEYDELRVKNDKAERELAVKIKAAEKGLVEIDNKRGRLARMLGGVTSPPETIER